MPQHFFSDDGNTKLLRKVGKLLPDYMPPHPRRTSNLSWKVAGSIPDEVIGFFNWPNPSSCTTALRVDLASNRNEYQESSWGQGRRERKADNLTAICEPIV
jgi:hypothetical protein